mmetsp:Transcript_23940/g.35144  ORF Transcript_23940/g.35144 Transcript_23940/m.35144 type:complete len:141 (-) Transcript_23940:71-493(-)
MSDSDINRIFEEFSAASDIKSRTFPSEVSAEILQELHKIVATGKLTIPWNILSPVVATLMHQELHNFFQKYGFVGPLSQTFESRKSELMLLLERYDEPPFTLQRILELLLNPASQYSSTHKLMNSLDKLLSVTTTISVDV